MYLSILDNDIKDEDNISINIKDENSIYIKDEDNIYENIKDEDNIYTNNENIEINNYVKKTIEYNIYIRNNNHPNCCLIYFQPIIVMSLDILTCLYGWYENFILWTTSILIVIDLFSITKKPLTIKGKRPSTIYNKYSIEINSILNNDNNNDNNTLTNFERERRIIYWIFLNFNAPDEDIWKQSLQRFKLTKVPKFTIRLWKKNKPTEFTIDVDELTFGSSIDTSLKDTPVVKGTRILLYYSDLELILISELNNTEKTKTRQLIKSVSGKIPIGGLLVERFIQDVGANKKLN